MQMPQQPPGMPLFDATTHIQDDTCYRNARDTMNKNINEYELFYMYSNPQGCTNGKAPDLMYQYSNLHSHIGYGPDSCAIDADSKLRAGLTHSRCKQELFTRLFLAVPNLLRGEPNPVEERKLFNHNSDPPGDPRQRGKVFENAAQFNFTPLIPSVKQAIERDQGTVLPWPRGGADTREWVYDIEYLNKCGMNPQNVRGSPVPQGQYIPRRGGNA